MMMTTAEEYDKRWLALALLCMAQFMVVLDASIVNIAMPTIGEALDFSQGSLSWIINGYILTFGGFLLLGGRMADLLGRRRVFMAGLVIVAVASLVAGFASSEGQLIAARAAQGLGAAIISPAALSIITTIFKDGSERNRALGAWGAVAGSGGAAGVLLGGVLTDGLGWEWVLWVNVPVALLVLALTPGLIPESRSESATRHFDVLGGVTVTAALSLLVYGIVEAEDAGWGSVQTLALLGASAGLLGAFYGIERRSDAPLVPFEIFRKRTLTGANAVGLVVGAALLSMFFFITLYMQQVLGYDAIESGVAYIPLTLAIISMSGVASQLVTRVGFKPVLAAGALTTSAGLFWFSFVSAGGSFLADILGPSLLVGAGLGLSFVPVTIAAVSGIEEHEQGLASGLINTTQQIGGAIGIAVLATLANSKTEDVMAGAGGDPSQLPNALVEGFQVAFVGGAVFALLGFVATLVLIRNSDSRAHVELSEQAEAAPVAA